MSEQILQNELLNKAKELVKQLDGYSRNEALCIVGFLHTEIDINSKVLFSPIYQSHLQHDYKED